jgi:chaperonin GroES
MKLRPLHDRVIVKRLEEERKTASPASSFPTPPPRSPIRAKCSPWATARILDDGKVASPLDVKVGDKVLFGKYAGQTVKVEGDELLVMREEDIMGVQSKADANVLPPDNEFKE